MYANLKAIGVKVQKQEYRKNKLNNYGMLKANIYFSRLYFLQQKLISDIQQLIQKEQDIQVENFRKIHQSCHQQRSI